MVPTASVMIALLDKMHVPTMYPCCPTASAAALPSQQRCIVDVQQASIVTVQAQPAVPATDTAADAAAGDMQQQQLPSDPLPPSQPPNTQGLSGAEGSLGSPPQNPVSDLELDGDPNPAHDSSHLKQADTDDGGVAPAPGIDMPEHACCSPRCLHFNICCCFDIDMSLSHNVKLVTSSRLL